MTYKIGDTIKHEGEDVTIYKIIPSEHKPLNDNEKTFVIFGKTKNGKEWVATETLLNV